MTLGDVSAEIALVAGAVAALGWAMAAPRHRQGGAAVMAGIALVAAAGLAAAHLGAGEARLGFDGSWAFDGATAWAELLITGVTAAAVACSPGWFATDPRHGEYYAVLLLGAAGACAVAGASDLSQLVVGVLLSSITGYTLAAYHRASPASVEAGMKYFLLGALTNVVLVAGVVLVFGLGGTTRLAGAARALPGSGAPAALVAAAVALAVGLAFKVGAAPAHAWMPDVAQGAPVPSAAFLLAVPKVGAMVALARLLDVLPDPASGLRPVLAAIAAVTMTLGNLAALGQDDVRRLLGWSSVSQTGYGLVAVVALGASPLALPALLIFLLAYSAANTAAFAVIAELRGLTALDDYRGLAGRRPLLGAGLTISLLSLVGIPPLAGFTGKLLVFSAAIDAGYAWLAALAVANTVVSLAYYLRVIAPIHLGEPAGAVAVLGRSAGVVAVVLVITVVAAGVAAGPLVDVATGARLLP